MPLDPNVKQLLDGMAAANLSPFDNVESLSAVELRATMEANRMPAPEVSVARYEDTSFTTTDGASIGVRVYWPANDQVERPAIVFFHGGGWAIGGLDTHDNSARELCNASDAVVVFIDYRLAPEALFPLPAEDCYAGLTWTVEHASELGIDASRLAVAGDSAGGNLAAVVALMAKERGGPVLRFQLLIYPCTDMDTGRWPSMTENQAGYLLTTTSMEWFYDQYVPDRALRTHPHASPIHAADVSGLPPALVITAEFDPLRDEGEAYGAKLNEAGVATEVRRYDGMIHGFVGMTAMFEQSRDAVALAGARVKAALA